MQRLFPLSFLALLLSVPALRAADQASAPPAERLSFHTDARWGRTLFIRNDAAQPTPAEVARRPTATPAPSGALFNRDDLGKPEWTNAVATARDFLRRHARDFLAPHTIPTGGASVPASRVAVARLASTLAPPATSAFDPDTDLTAVRAERDALGMTHVRFAQTFHGLPVFGADASVHLAPDGRVSSAGARLVPDGPADVQPTLNREQAVARASALWKAEFQLQVEPAVRSSNLCVIAPGMLKNDGDSTAYLVWEIKLVNGCTECPTSRFPEDYYMDARTGELRFQHTGVHRLYRKIYDCTTYPYRSLCSSSWVNPVTGYHHGRR